MSILIPDLTVTPDQVEALVNGSAPFVATPAPASRISRVATATAKPFKAAGSGVSKAAKVAFTFVSGHKVAFAVGTVIVVAAGTAYIVYRKKARKAVEEQYTDLVMDYAKSCVTAEQQFTDITNDPAGKTIHNEALVNASEDELLAMLETFPHKVSEWLAFDWKWARPLGRGSSVHLDPVHATMKRADQSDWNSIDGVVINAKGEAVGIEASINPEITARRRIKYLVATGHVRVDTPTPHTATTKATWTSKVRQQAATISAKAKELVSRKSTEELVVTSPATVATPAPEKVAA